VAKGYIEGEKAIESLRVLKLSIPFAFPEEQVNLREKMNGFLRGRVLPLKIYRGGPTDGNPKLRRSSRQGGDCVSSAWGISVARD